MKLVLTIFTLLTALSAQAGPIPFTSVSVDLLAGASIQEPTGLTEDRPPSISGVSADLPLTNDAVATSAAGNQASSFIAIDTDFFLAGSASVDLSQPGDTQGSADATLALSGDFLNPGSPLQLLIDFETFSLLANGATGGGELVVRVVAGGVAILSDILNVTASPSYLVDLGSAASATLELLFSVNANAPDAGVADVQSTVRFALVPEPSTVSMLLIGAAAALRRRHARP